MDIAFPFQRAVGAARLPGLTAGRAARSGGSASAAVERRTAALAEQVSGGAATGRPPITTHVLDTALGVPAAGVALLLERREEGGWRRLGGGETNSDGRCASLQAAGSRPQAGEYRLSFATGAYLGEPAVSAFYPSVAITFRISAEQAAAGQHFHVPLLLSPFGYSTYRGS